MVLETGDRVTPGGGTGPIMLESISVGGAPPDGSSALAACFGGDGSSLANTFDSSEPPSSATIIPTSLSSCRTSTEASGNSVTPDGLTDSYAAPNLKYNLKSKPDVITIIALLEIAFSDHMIFHVTTDPSGYHRNISARLWLGQKVLAEWRGGPRRVLPSDWNASWTM
ncbi:hypothetical protein MKZ38_007089 [Zalerion maritima]|uniref:Uncharacterized protein n=1 Tax=Zalerion maritima TaxID=339359 RepID=A0AAD5RIU2_9PEZI|nr:hypothetical protein MKZ38_007089 [Zalerion maritima]